MKLIKKHFGAITFILIILIINSALWIYLMTSRFYKTDTILSSLSGSFLLMGFFLVFLLSTRMKLLIKIFGGLDNIYFFHRILAISTTAFIFVHQITSENIGLFNHTNIFLLGQSNKAGELARNLFLFLIAFALLAKFFKYEHFRFIHRLLIIPYIFALYHGFYSSWVNLFSFDILSIWMISTSVIGLSSALYMILFYQTTAFKFKGLIVGKEMLTDSILEIKVKMQKKYSFIPGQFAFIKIDDGLISKSSHPFSISGQNDEFIYFTIKSLGDYTNSLIETLEVPVRINITKPYGSMTFKAKTKKQTWIAGGIGITPFLGYLRSPDSLDKPIHLIYSVRNMEEAVHLETLDNLIQSRSHFSYTIFDSATKGYLSIKDIDLDNDTTVYMCGPRPMVKSLNKQISTTYPNINIHFEAFAFTGTLVEDIISFIKRLYKSIVKTKKQKQIKKKSV